MVTRNPADTRSMKSHDDTSLVILPLVVIAIGVGIFAGYAVAVAAAVLA